ncbi:hypothetical protein EAH_00066260 [Eimeria acervulina]|uniref:Uncharacterized protein n=1 Tax=Eimeria acervulina TaxID=5801 RepID=U6GUY0_EIMAC|nr:hypothetical protein EAH_00066260 [Eimeria acervulina]CDI82384.1 hypothetical protein EAH_00066260 [Eimeria acervulina]
MDATFPSPSRHTSRHRDEHPTPKNRKPNGGISGSANVIFNADHPLQKSGRTNCWALLDRLSQDKQMAVQVLPPMQIASHTAFYAVSAPDGTEGKWHGCAEPALPHAGAMIVYARDVLSDGCLFLAHAGGDSTGAAHSP